MSCTQARHTKAAEALAKELGWTGLWVAGGKPEEDGYMFVNLDRHKDSLFDLAVKGHFGREDEDWFYVPCAVEGCLEHG